MVVFRLYSAGLQHGILLKAASHCRGLNEALSCVPGKLISLLCRSCVLGMALTELVCTCPETLKSPRRLKKKKKKTLMASCMSYVANENVGGGGIRHPYCLILLRRF